MSNPLDNNELTFYLQFNNEDSFGEIPITEVVKFDGATYITMQEAMRYGRDVEFLNENIDLMFYKGFYDTTTDPLMLPNGTIVYNLTMGFEQLLATRKLTGFESDVVIGIRKNGVDFVLGNLDFQGSETDEFTYISCKAIQTTEKAKIKRFNEITVDVFNDEDLNGDYIDPLQAFNVLLKAKPIVYSSSWSAPDYTHNSVYYGAQATGYYPIFNQLETYGIADSISSFEQVVEATTGVYSGFREQARKDMTIIKAKTNLSNIKINIKDLSLSCTFDGIFPVSKELVVIWGESYVQNEYDVVSLLNTLDNTVILNNENYEVIIDDLQEGGFIAVYFNIKDYYLVPSVTPSSSGGITVTSGSISITATSTNIDTVIKGVRYVDLFKQCVKSMNGFPVYAPKFDVGGKFYDQVAFSGNLIKGRDDVPFNVNFKDLVETLQEVNADYQTLDESVYIGQYSDFYPNKEIGVLEAFPDQSSKSYFNDRFALLSSIFGYNNYEKGEDEENTIDTVHTYSQWLYPNKQVDSTKEIKLKQVRDSFKIEKTKNEAIKTTTSTDEDYKLFLLDLVSLAPNSFNEFQKLITHNYSGGELKLLNDGSFSWLVIGVSVGGFINILNTVNVGNYEILEITDNIITLDGSGNSSLDETITIIKHYYTNVQYTNRTNEGFTSIENVLNPDKFANLRYTIKRNLKHWYSYFATAGKFWQNKQFRNTEFINNGALSTTYGTETEPTIEDANVDILDFGDAILSENMYEGKLIAGYDNMVNILNAIKTVNSDDTIGGFIRTFNNTGEVRKVYPTKLEYEPTTETLNLTGEIKEESDVLTIYKEDGKIYVDNTAYDINTTLNWFEINNDYLIVYDNNNLKITNEYHYSKVLVSGLSSSSPESLSNKLIQI